jgi:DNA-binding MarR family transcriptional regulator
MKDDLSLAQRVYLGVIETHPGANITRIANLVGRSNAAAGRAIRNLERLGLVLTEPDENDERAVLVWRDQR